MGMKSHMSGFTKLIDKYHHYKNDTQTFASVAKDVTEDRVIQQAYVDLTIQFIGASDLPKMDVVGSADPYFVAQLDEKISFVSSVKENTLAPVWNEPWIVRNVPSTAELTIAVHDKDMKAPTDDYIGKCTLTVSPGTKEVVIESQVLKRTRGTFWLKIESTRSTGNPAACPYLFSGPVRYSRHFSPTVGRLTNLNLARLYSTWKMALISVPLYFHDNYQHWNKDYKAAQSIFQGPTSIVVRSGIQAGHRLLYARGINNGFGIIDSFADVVDLLQAGGENETGKRIKPAVYTYIISAEDDSFRFSETGAPFFVDFASKHALHSNCAEIVRYSGEFHPRPKGGWENFSESQPDSAVEWELVFDNNSGTYAPDKNLLPVLKELLRHNFPGITIVTHDFHDDELKKSTDACRDYASKYRGVGQDEFEPTRHPGDEETLAQRAKTMMKPSQQAKDWRDDMMGKSKE